MRHLLGDRLTARHGELLYSPLGLLPSSFRRTPECSSRPQARYHHMVLVLGLLLFGHVDTDLLLYNRLFASIANPSHAYRKPTNGRDHGHILMDHQ